MIFVWMKLRKLSLGVISTVQPSDKSPGKQENLHHKGKLLGIKVCNREISVFFGKYEF